MSAEPIPFPSADRTPAPVDGARHVVIVGAGFGGLACARRLAKSDRRVTVIDRRNYHLFQPLLYQVATAALSPADIAIPVRRILWRARNVDLVMASVQGVDLARRRVALAEGGYVPFDVLVLATGARYNYFGHPEWARHALSLKGIGDARRIRTKLLAAFEEAEICPDPARREALLTTVIVGGGPTGVEMAGSVAELARYTLPREFRRIDPARARIVLVEAGPRLLAAFPERLSAYARTELERLGVEVRLDTKVEAVEAGRVRAGGQEMGAGAIVWAAGVEGADGPGWLGAATGRHGRLKVDVDLSVPGHDGIYALGDVAVGDDNLPALAQVAQQQGAYLGRWLARADRPGVPFRFRDRGDTAIVGRNAAVYAWGRWTMKGRLAWIFWALVHIVLLIDFEKRTLVSVQWLWRYLTYSRGVRLID
ncbi:NAD(P)/FAD-dependent oxidoreductase [Enhydrobacter sp.]|jgi:NADH dehydrogenase|uniref:NAD(P)/FAD-dependent oxidoreductase n=1 Tax=Enhydrobacter sp. TaxID=1894999 RepID=UPI00261B8BA3|nr:NAD(P)/FAD-dependent oxidoreductase [Enhydrobacter sp.]WIM09208.1 MAG: NADH dehydrogenase [Enhydrobacter sp.]